jgi:hypothetical protein
MIASPAEKVCKKCGASKPLTAFYQRSSCRLGVMARCAVCISAEQSERRRLRWAADRVAYGALQRAYNRTFDGKIMMCFHNMRGRAEGIQKAKAHLYEGLEVLPRRQFYQWALHDASYRRLYLAWVESGYDQKLTPSVDRMDSQKGYTLGNIRWITHSENSRLGAVSKRRKK